MRDFALGGLMLPALLLVAGPGSSSGQTIKGDLDKNHEVSVSDVPGFAGCLSGPEVSSSDSICTAAHFDVDDDVDLRDIASFQNRFGFGVGPPRIDRFWPTPGEWIVDDVGLREVRIGFSETVTVPETAIVVWLASAGISSTKVEPFTLVYDAEGDVWTILFDRSIPDDRVTLVVDYAIEDLSGRPLDGEIFNPHHALLPSGDGHNGGQAAFRINVLQGDVDRNGVVDESDASTVQESLGFCNGDAGFSFAADLNGDRCVDEIDLAITTISMGHQLPLLDGTPPKVLAMYADGPFGTFDTLDILFSESVDAFRANERTCFLLDADDNMIVPSYYGSDSYDEVLGFFIVPRFSHCNLFRINISNAVIDLSGEFLEVLQPCTCLEDCPPYGDEP